jgi:hypothetical protein
MSIARTATGLEGALLIDVNGALVTSASLLLGEMRQFLIPPEDERWVPLDGSDVDARRYPNLARGLGREKKLPKMEHYWVYAG